LKAVVYVRYGSPDVLALQDVPIPIPADDEVLIKIHATGVNPMDMDMLTGRPYLYRLLSGVLGPRRKILGMDVAGTVEAVGANAKRFRPGDAVLGDISACNWGGFAECVCAPERALTHKPEGLSFEAAAAAPQAAVLALQGLRDKGTLLPGHKVLINGAGGGVGTFAIQLAKAAGAEVTAVDSAEKLDMLRALGADHVIDYKREDFTRNGILYDRILDTVGRRSIFAYKRSLRPGGVFALIGGTLPVIFQTALLGPLLSMSGRRTMGLLIHQPNKDLDVIAGQMAAGTLKVVIDRTFPLTETAEALRYLGAWRARGKVVVTTQALDPHFTSS
jgi:NADPH:quinone reductase-like Zn-dependent oxidoreductase